MQMSTGILLLLVVLAALLGSCSCDCDGFDTDTERSQRCALIYDMLEEALVSNKVNLYRLQDAFLSSTHRNPAWLRVNYMLQKYDESVILVWSSSTANVLFLELLQPGLLTAFFYEQKIGSLPDTHSLDIQLQENSLLSKSTAAEWDHAWATLTARLKAYAKTQGKLGSWDGSDRGYTWMGLSSVDPLMLSASFLLMIATLGLSIKFTPHLMKYLREEANQETRPVTGLFWAFTIAAFLYNCTSAIDILLLVESCSCLLTVCASKVVVLFFSIAAGITWMLWAYCGATAVLPPHPKKCCLRFLYSFAFFNVSFSMCNLAATIIPTFLLATVYPIEVLSTAALVCAVVFCFVSVLAVLFSHKKMSECRRASSSACTIILLSLFLISILLVGILYSKTIRQSNNLISIVFSFLPSALLTAVGYATGKKLFKAHQKSVTETDEDHQSHNGDTDLLTCAEEGSQAPADEEQAEHSVKDD